MVYVLTMNVQVLYEDNHLIAVNKPTGYLVQADETGDPTVADWVKRYIKDRYDKPGDVFLGVIHRLDRPVSGVLLYARTSKGLSRMNELFRKRQVEKTYWAVTTEQPNPLEGKLVHYLSKDERRNVTNASLRQRGNAKRAELSYALHSRIGSHSLLEVKPHTGRPHQIRVQLARHQCPIYGDLKYGANTPTEDGSILLHSRSLAFEHPVKREPVRITASLPKHPIWDLFA